MDYLIEDRGRVAESRVIAIVGNSMQGFPFDVTLRTVPIPDCWRDARGGAAWCTRCSPGLTGKPNGAAPKYQCGGGGPALSRARRLEDRETGGALYHEWSHNASLADGISAIYTGLESELEAIGNEIDEYTPRGDASHADLVDGMASALNDVRPAVLGEATRELMHEARKFRHVVRNKYALRLKQADVARNFRLVKKLVPAFLKDYRRFVRLMLE